jgi:hypothetical protein
VWFSPGTPLTSTNKTVCHDIPEILYLIKILSVINFTDEKWGVWMCFICLFYYQTGIYISLIQLVATDVKMLKNIYLKKISDVFSCRTVAPIIKKGELRFRSNE